MARQFTCDNCLQTYEADDDWTEEEKLAEMEENFPEIDPEDRAVVCDACFDLVRAVLNAPHGEPFTEFAERLAGPPPCGDRSIVLH